MRGEQEKGSKQRYLPTPLSRLNGEQGCECGIHDKCCHWERSLNVSTSVLLGCSFKVFPQRYICQAWCYDAVRVIFGKAWQDSVRIVYYNFCNKSSPSFACCLYVSHTSTCLFCEIFSLTVQACLFVQVAAVWIPAWQTHFLFLFVSHMGWFNVPFTISHQTQTHTLMCTRAHGVRSVH